MTSGLAFVPLLDVVVSCATKVAIPSWTVRLRDALEDLVEGVELVPPGVRTTLTPGQEDRDGPMLLHELAEEAKAPCVQQPTPPEILIETVNGSVEARSAASSIKFSGNSMISIAPFDSAWTVARCSAALCQHRVACIGGGHHGRGVVSVLDEAAQAVVVYRTTS